MACLSHLGVASVLIHDRVESLQQAIGLQQLLHLSHNVPNSHQGCTILLQTCRISTHARLGSARSTHATTLTWYLTEHLSRLMQTLTSKFLIAPDTCPNCPRDFLVDTVALLCTDSHTNTAHKASSHCHIFVKKTSADAYLVLSPVTRQASQEELVRRILNDCLHDVQRLQVHRGVRLRGPQEQRKRWVVVVRPPDLEAHTIQ